MRSEANILPQIVPEILGDKLNLNGIWCLLPFNFLDMCHLHAINSQIDLKISSIEDAHSGRLCWTCFQKPSPPNLPLLCCTKQKCTNMHAILIKDTFFNVLPQQLLGMKTYVDDN